MRPFLVVGCGGSGGVTLQFLMDQLSADLNQRGVAKIPAAWQFVHIDVPIAADGTSPGLPPVVSQQGGRYVALGPQAANYLSVASSVTEQLIAAKAYGQLSTWAAHPDRTPVDIAQGAGQMRAVGRIVTLSRLHKVKEGLQGALDDLNAAGVREELADVARTLGGDVEQTRGKPIVIVVSSMAGGAGASMVLDVCRVLSQFDMISTELTALFLYTPEIFDSIDETKRSGIPGNALAMMGELIATQLGAATRDDNELFAALRMGSARPNRGVPFGRVFPIGAKIGESGSKFGNGRLGDIYRGVGRGLAALVLSSEVTNSWSAYDLTNNTSAPGTTEAFGWSAVPKDLQWGSFGFAQLSLGRDRYAEYAAQRLARTAVLRLLQGHRSPRSSQTDAEQLERVATERSGGIYEGLHLPRGSFDTWFDQTYDALVQACGQRVVAAHVEGLLGQASGSAQQWVGYVVSELNARRQKVDEAAGAEAYRVVHGWYEALLVSTQQVLSEAVARDGIPTAVRLLTRLQSDLDSWSSRAREGARLLSADPTALPPEALAKANALKGQLDARHAIVPELRTAYQRAAAAAVKGKVAAHLGDVLVSYKNEMLEPLRRALNDASASLQLAVSSEKRGAGLAQLRTDEFAEWPVTGELVPPRFTQAQNEVLLVKAVEFPTRFDEHITLSARSVAGVPDPSAGDAAVMAVTEIIRDHWETRAAQRRGALLVEQSRWRPSSMARRPDRVDTATTGAAAFRLAVKPDELVQRARDWIARPAGPFNEYVSTTLREYVAAEDLPDAKRQHREQEVAASFRKTLELAQPLVAVDANLVRALHGLEPEVAYKFSEVPFKGFALEAQLRKELEASGADANSVRTYEGALRPGSSTARIDVFGSFTPLAPLTFTSLLRPLAAGWASASMSRQSFWQLRRTRRLPGAVPMTEQHRRAVVGGWYVARFTNHLRLPGESHGLAGVQVYDSAELQDWVSFPQPLIVDDLELERTTSNYLPAVVMSFGLAMAQASAQSTLAPLQPYTVLRRFWDDSASGLAPNDPVSMLAATRYLRTWLAERQSPPGAPSARVTPSVGDAELDRKALLETIYAIREALGRDYRAPNAAQGAEGGGSYSVISRPQDLWAVPFFHEIALDAFVVLGELSQIVAEVDIPSPGGAAADSSVDLAG